MGISSYTNIEKLSGVLVHSRGATDTLMSALAVTGTQLEDSGFVSRLNVTINDSGNLNNATCSDSIENIHSGGKVNGGVVANHTVQNVLYGGQALSCQYGINSRISSVISAAPTSSVTSASEIITDGTIKRVGYITSTVYENEITQFTMPGDASQNGSAIVTNNGILNSGTINDRGKLFISNGGLASNVIINGIGRIDVLAGGALKNVTESNGYSVAQAASHGNIVTQTRTCISAVYGIPTSGYTKKYVSANGASSITASNVWYRVDDEGAVIESASNAMTITSDSNRASAVCVLNGPAATWSDVNGSYSLLIASNLNVDSWFMSAREAVWKNTAIDDPNNYLAIEYSIHDDNYPYWDLCSVSKYVSGTETVYKRTLKAYAPAYTDVETEKQTDAKTARIAGPELTIHSSGNASAVGVPTNGHLTVNQYGILHAGEVKDYGTLVVNQYAAAGFDNTNTIKLSSNATLILNVPGSSIKKYMSAGKLIFDENSSVYVDSTGTILPAYTGIVSAVYLPSVNTQRDDARTNAIGIYGRADGSVSAYGIKLTDGDLLYTNSGVIINDFTISSGGKILFNSGASGIIGNISTGGVLNVQQNAFGSSIIVYDGGHLNIDPCAEGDYIISSGGHVSCTLSRYTQSNTILTGGTSANSGVVGYVPEDIAAYGTTGWTYESGVTNASFTNVTDQSLIYRLTSDTVVQRGKIYYTYNGTTYVQVSLVPGTEITAANAYYENLRLLSYSVKSGTTTITGTMSRPADIKERDVVYIDTTSTKETCGLINGDDTLDMVLYNTTNTSSAVIAHAKLTNTTNHKVIGITYDTYTVGKGINALVNVTDRVKLGGGTAAGFVADEVASCTLNISGDVVVNGANIVKAVGAVTDTVINLNGYVHDSYTHIAEINNIDAKDGMILYIGSNVIATTIPTTSQNLNYQPILLRGTLTPQANQTLYLTQGSNYQFVSSINTTNASSAVAVGINITEADSAVIVGNDTYGYGFNVASTGKLRVLSAGNLIGATIDNNGEVEIAQSGNIYQAAANGANAIVTVGDYSICELTTTNQVNVVRKAMSGGKAVVEQVICTLSRGYTAPADRGSAVYKIYENVKPVIAGSSFETNSAYAATIPFWYCKNIDSSYEDTFLSKVAAAERDVQMCVYYLNPNNGNVVHGSCNFTFTSGPTIFDKKWTNGYLQLEYIFDVDARIISSGAYAGSAIGAVKPNKWVMVVYTNANKSAIYDIELVHSAMRVINTTDRYYIQNCSVTSDTSTVTLTSSLELANAYTGAYAELLRTPYGTYTSIIPTGAMSIAKYNNLYTVRPNITNPVIYTTNEDARISCILNGTNNGIKMDVYRFGSDAEGKQDSALYHHTDSWVNSANGSTFYDSGVVATSSGKVVVADRTLVAPTVLSNGYIYMDSSAVVHNATIERMGVIDAAFGRGYFYIDGHAVRASSAYSGKLDDYINIAGTSLLGDNDNDTYTLEIVDNLTSGDNRVWTNEFVSTKGQVTISRILTVNTSGADPKWTLFDSHVSKYTNAISTFRNAISAETGAVTSERALLQATKWLTGNVTFNASGSMSFGSTFVDVMSHVTYTGSTIVLPTGVVVSSDRLSAMSAMGSTLFINAGIDVAKYVIATSDTYVNVMSYDPNVKKYVTFDNLDGIYLGSSLTSKVLEGAGHNRDPWWIKGDHTELNTDNATVMSGGSIMRANTNKFIIQDNTLSYTLFRTAQGVTVENKTSASTEYLTYDDAYVGYAGTISASIACVVSNTANVGGNIVTTNGGAIIDTVFSGGNAAISCCTNSRWTEMKNVALKDNAYLRFGGTIIGGGDNNGICNYVSTCSVAGSTRFIPNMPITVSGNKSLNGVLYPNGNTEYNAFSGLTGLFDDFVSMGIYGYINTPYAMCKHIYASFGSYERLQYDNYDIPNAYTSSGLGFDTCTNNYGSSLWGNYFWGSSPYRAVAKNMVTSSGDSVRIARDMVMLDIVSKPGTTLVRSDVAGWYVNSDFTSKHYQAWVTPYLTAVRDNQSTNYWNTQQPFLASEFTSAGSTVCALNSTYHAPVFSSGTSYPTSTVANCYVFANCDSAVTIDKEIVHVQPGAVMGYGDTNYVSMGLSAGLFVDAHAMVFNLDTKTNISGTLPLNVRVSSATTDLAKGNVHRTRLQKVQALNEAIIFAKYDANTIKRDNNRNQFCSTINQCANKVEDTNFNGYGRVFYGNTKPVGTEKWSFTEVGSSQVISSSINDAFINTTTTNPYKYVNGYIQTSAGQYCELFIHSNVFLRSSETTGELKPANLSINNYRCLYIGSNATLSCNVLTLNAGAVLVLDKGANIDAIGVNIGSNAKVVCMDSSINFNEQTTEYVISNAGSYYSSGTPYYSRTGSGTAASPYVYTQAGTMTTYGRIPTNMYAKTSGCKYRFGTNAQIQYMNGFRSDYVPNNSARDYDYSTDSWYRTPSQFAVYSGYDVPNANGGCSGGLTFYQTTNSTVVDSIKYKVYSGAGYNQTFTMSYMSGIVNPLTNESFKGWVIEGNYETAPGVITSNAILYACSHTNPIGSDWMRINGRHCTPITYSGNDHRDRQHICKDTLIYDCNRTNVTSSSFNNDNYPEIQFVNGIVSGIVVSGNEVTLGQTGIITAGTTINAGAKVCIRDYVDHRNAFSGVSCLSAAGEHKGYIAFGGCSVLDNISNDVVIVSTDTESPTNCAFTMSAGEFAFNVISCTDPVQVMNYPFSNTTTADCIVPFVVKKCTFSGTGTGKLIWAQPVSNVVLTGVTCVAKQLTWDVDIGSDAGCIVESKVYKARVTNGSMVISNYARNVLVESGATVSICANASCDNVTVMSGGTLDISGYVTGFKNSGGTITPATVDSKFIRTEVLFDEDYDWSN